MLHLPGWPAYLPSAHQAAFGLPCRSTETSYHCQFCVLSRHHSHWPICVQTVDANVRTQTAAHDTLVRMSQVKSLNMGAQMPFLVKPMKNQAAWRPVLGRLKLLAALIPILGVSKGQAGDGVPGDALMKFVGAAFSSPNADVRAAALTVALQVSQGSEGFVEEN